MNTDSNFSMNCDRLMSKMVWIVTPWLQFLVWILEVESTVWIVKVWVYELCPVWIMTRTQVTYNLNLSCHLGDKVLGLTLVALMIFACMGLAEAWVWHCIGSNKVPFPFPLLELLQLLLTELPSALFKFAGLLGTFLVSRLLKLIRKLESKNNLYSCLNSGNCRTLWELK